MTAGEARRFSSVHVMKQGTSVTGTVQSPTGRPVAGATVVVQSMGDQWTRRRLQTDRQGQFRTGRFIDPKWAEIMLTVQADGAAWAMRQITVTPEIPPQVIKLAPRKPLRGRVVDSQGQPIPGAAVGSTNGLRNGHFDWEAETDADGRFVWFEVPVTGTILLDVYKAPFVQALGRRVEPGSDEVTITLHRPQHLHGTVTDAETGRPIDRFVLIPGWGPRPVPGRSGCKAPPGHSGPGSSTSPRASSPTRVSRARSGSRPRATCPASCSDDTLTDESGRFVWERVTPGRMGVYRYVADANHRGRTASNPVDVDVKPGETVRVQVGGTGRPVVGRLTVPAGIALSDLVLDNGGNLLNRATGADNARRLPRLDAGAATVLVGRLLPDARGPHVPREPRAAIRPGSRLGRRVPSRRRACGSICRPAAV